MPDTFRQGESGDALGIAESRAHARTRVNALAYIELAEGNGGLILNISEDGLAVQAVQVLAADFFPSLRFRLPKTDITIEAAGRMVWQIRSKKEAGIQFVDLPEEARGRIREWIAADPSRIAGAREVAARGIAAKGTASPAVSTGPPQEKPQPSPRMPSRPQPVVPAQSNAAPASAPPPKPAATAPTSQAPPPPQTPAGIQSKAPAVPAQPPPAASQVPPPPQTPTSIRSNAPAVPPQPPPAPVPAVTVPPCTSVPEPGGPAPTGRTAPPPPRIPGSDATVPFRAATAPAVAQPIRERFSADAPFRPRFPNTPQWVRPTLEDMEMEFKNPRRWWAYTAALGFLAALGVVTMLLFDPGAISRALQQNLPSQPDVAAVNSASSPTATPQANAPAGSNAHLPSSTHKPPAGMASPSGAANQGLAQNLSPATSGILNSKPLASQRVSGLAGAASQQAAQPARPEVRQPVSTPSGTANSAGSPPLESPKTTATQARPTEPSPAVPQRQSPEPVTSPNSSAAAEKPTTSQRDQDAYAYARRDQDAYAQNASKPIEPTRSAPTRAAAPPPNSTESPNTGTSPVVPSVPLEGIPSGSVAGSSQFHAIRIPPELQSKAAQLAGNLQIGQLLSSYSPSYPVEAARQGVEGVVRLDVIVGPNGDVQSAKVLSGPPMLTDASINAVKQWRYGVTLLGGNAIGSEQYVTLVFRLSK
ncbi:MAG TPA: TonB family protein [Candidatus Limnocylindrales bacterium]|nr:TonB family protein [Candidatus Limnocylindrales bacterium]